MRIKRIFGYCLLVTTLNACAQAIPVLSDNETKVTLKSRAGHHLSAQRLNGSLVNDSRFFIVQPGQHQLSVRVSYERGGAVQGSSQRHCLAQISYPDFKLTEDYRVLAIAKGFTVRVWMENQHGVRLVESQRVSCGSQY